MLVEGSTNKCWSICIRAGGRVNTGILEKYVHFRRNPLVVACRSVYNHHPKPNSMHQRSNASIFNVLPYTIFNIAPTLRRISDFILFKTRGGGTHNENGGSGKKSSRRLHSRIARRIIQYALPLVERPRFENRPRGCVIVHVIRCVTTVHLLTIMLDCVQRIFGLL